MQREHFERMSPGKRMDFIKAGGKVVDPLDSIQDWTERRRVRSERNYAASVERERQRRR
jgi:hypothetical protein